MRERVVSAVMPKKSPGAKQRRGPGRQHEKKGRTAHVFVVALVAVAMAGISGSLDRGASASGAPWARAAKRCGAKRHGYVKRLLRLHNVQRRRHHLHNLHRNTELSSAARQHACDMVSHHYFGHVSPGGKGPVDRVAATGYGHGRSWSMEENILCWSPALSPHQAMVKWLNSPPHRANIFGGQWRDVGIAAIAGSPSGGGITLVVEFGRRRR